MQEENLTGGGKDRGVKLTAHFRLVASTICLPPAFTLVSCSGNCSTLKMETISYSETSVAFSTRRYSSENTTPQVIPL
jgi:hypothetical protein